MAQARLVCPACRSARFVVPDRQGNYGSNVWLMPFLRRNVPYDPVKDFVPVTLAVRAPTILLVHPSLPVRTLRDLITLALEKHRDLRELIALTKLGAAT